MVIKTPHDGWDCVPELKEAVDELSYNDKLIYEINNCVRVTPLHLIVQDLRDNLHEALSILEDIDCTKEFETDLEMDPMFEEQVMKAVLKYIAEVVFLGAIGAVGLLGYLVLLEKLGI